MQLDYTATRMTADGLLTSEDFIINVEAKSVNRASCQWRISRSATQSKTVQYFSCLDLLLKIDHLSASDTKSQYDRNGCLLKTAHGTKLEDLCRTICRSRTTAIETTVVIKALIVPRGGFLSRKDIIQLRMRDSGFVDSIQLLGAERSLSSPSRPTAESLLAILPSCPAAFILKADKRSYDETWALFEKDLSMRLSIDWILPSKLPSRRVAVIGGRPAFDLEKQWYGSQGPFEAAQALNLSLVVVDRLGHWLGDDAYAHLREKFVAVDVVDDEELPLRIVEALKSEMLDGIVTFSDEFVIATAKAAAILNLPTDPIESILQAHNKYETRKLISTYPPTFQSFLLDRSAGDSRTIEEFQDMRYPLIVKPSRGAGSRGVKKVNDYPSLCLVMRQLEELDLMRHGVIIESYIDGPEVDANFVLWEGEILFCEISDDFPCQADAADATTSDNFAETVMLLPSRLPVGELEVIKSSLHQSLIQLGFRSGVFHLEARVVNSSMRYEDNAGIVDLSQTTSPAEGQPSVFLIEVNARPPGLQSAFATLYTYGVDYCALQFLRAINDSERFHALAKPFAFQAQYWCEILFIPIHRACIVIPDQFCEKVLQQLPEAVPLVSRAEVTATTKVVSPKGGTGLIGYFLLHSTTSRRHVLEVGERIKIVSRIILG